MSIHPSPIYLHLPYTITLQVRDTNGTWVEARPIPGTILVNAGDLLQMWTAGKFIATVSIARGGRDGRTDETVKSAT